MEYQDNLIAGIPPGGVRDPSTVKIMICYLLQRLDRPVSESELVELLTGDQTVNYFLLTTALSGLKKLGHLRQKGDSLLLTQLGRRTAEELGGELPVTLRERGACAGRDIAQGEPAAFRDQRGDCRHRGRLPSRFFLS